MNADRKKQLKQAYKQKELQKMADSGDEILAAFAEEQLIDKLPILLIEEIKLKNDSELIEFLWVSIRKLIAFKKRVQWKQYKSEYDAINSLSDSQKMIHFTQIFEGLNYMGDLEKFLSNSFDWELSETVQSYRLIDCHGIAERIERANEMTEKIHFNEQELTDKKLSYIKTHIEGFEIK